MKKVLSVFLSLVMLLSVTAGMNITASALESTGNVTMDSFINDGRFTNGASWAWNKGPVLASFSSMGCCAYCADYVKYCYGNNNPRSGSVFYSVSDIQAGDVLTVGNQSDGTGHWFVCLKRSGNRLYVAEGNVDNKVRIGWNYTISGNKFSEDSRSFTAGYHYYPVITPSDSSGPSYDDFHVGEFRDGGFTVMAHVTDPSGISSVRYAVWTDKDGWDDLTWYTGNHTDNNGYFWIHVDFANHKSEKGKYTIHMYAYDNAGNESSAGISYTFPDKAPVVSNIKVSNVSSKGYTVTCTVKSVSDMGVSRVQFPTWTSNKGQDDLAAEWWTNTKVRGTISGNTVTFRVNASDHNNETGTYITHIYAYDKIGNADSVGVSVNVHEHKATIVKGKAATCTANGLTDGYKCSICGEIMTSQKTIAATGHISDKGTVTKKATYTETGTKTYKCTVCGQVLKTETIPKLEKKTNPIKASGKTATVKYSNLKKKNQSIAQKNAFSVSGAQGKVTYAKSSGNAKITVSSAGKITVKKGLKKGTYKVKVKVKAAGNSKYKSKTVIVTVTIKVK